MSTITVTAPSLELREFVRESADHGRLDTGVTPQIALDSQSSVLRKGRSIIVTTMLALVLAVNSVTIGLLTVGIPHISADLKLSENLILW